MGSYSIFDIAGPIMIGPSSSHTAGAVKLGQMARALFDATPEKATFLLHGSFATVYKGHATDKALLAGVMKFQTKDPRIKEAFAIAKEQGLAYEFQTGDLGIAYHPNTVKITLEKEGIPPMEVVGSSIGGGNIEVKKIDEFDVDFRGAAGRYFTLIFCHKDKPGMLALITKAIADKGANIANLQNSRLSKGGKALTIVCLDSPIALADILAFEKNDDMYFVRSLTSIDS
ncbi:MAG TPA: L-serine ammonia-lyase, iron-sulfur-dependent, subunit beta [Candidatus Magasanikbacteria bacterium]|nr:MAG: L-serine dehydratase, iron-sulfur-dependent subunit beta [Candidatus Magasanikbacteria bacterium RIFCSPLOWO2_02_FULL_47_16]OGH79989.1 MAG: L-serine dehydratase, iron-sulfur-dependent subunit beta [Candidatus Magasanikbacteria bacterium RIFCSPHIGHO2_02_FULL_48_18]OGH83482.1 MAG: L-serine dehydratase, iron-sulfur-dependent subunit beta [Candidatus Magasanikbacteria bacterium RIFCSPLOWO2_12_FULL_47_9b]HAZ28534.1 L-serine ammonia-lyase, iron-sulfur-dependent, subunit beta [Candidatus Magasan